MTLLVQPLGGDSHSSMAAKRLRQSELEARLRFRRLDIIGEAIQTAIPWGSLIAIAWFCSTAVRALAGQETFTDIGISVLGDLRINDGLAYILGIGGMSYGYGQHRLRRKVTERLTKRTTGLEERLDPDRSSSGVTTQGTTRPGD